DGAIDGEQAAVGACGDVENGLELAVQVAGAAPLCQHVAVEVEGLDAVVATIAYVNGIARADGDPGRPVELAGTPARRTPLEDVPAVTGELHDAVVAGVANVDVAGRIGGDTLRRREGATVRRARAVPLALQP